MSKQLAERHSTICTPSRIAAISPPNRSRSATFVFAERSTGYTAPPQTQTVTRCSSHHSPPENTPVTLPPSNPHAAIGWSSRVRQSRAPVPAVRRFATTAACTESTGLPTRNVTIAVGLRKSPGSVSRRRSPTPSASPPAPRLRCHPGNSGTRTLNGCFSLRSRVKTRPVAAAASQGRLAEDTGGVVSILEVADGDVVDTSEQPTTAASKTPNPAAARYDRERTLLMQRSNHETYGGTVVATERSRHLADHDGCRLGRSAARAKAHCRPSTTSFPTKHSRNYVDAQRKPRKHQPCDRPETHHRIAAIHRHPDPGAAGLGFIGDCQARTALTERHRILATPSPSATRATVRCWHTIASSASRSPRRDSFARGSAARLVSWRQP